MKQYLIVLVACMLSMYSFAQQYGSFKDPRDGRVYKTVKIGDQEWMAENSQATRFRNGDSIPIISNSKDWIRACREGLPACCFYKNDKKNILSYGVLYNWYAVRSRKGILAPEGWVIPSAYDFRILINYLGGDTLATKKLKKENSWIKESGNNESGFGGIAGGVRDILEDTTIFKGVGKRGAWWSRDRSAESYSLEHDGLLEMGGHALFLDSVHRYNPLDLGDVGAGYSVRFIKEKDSKENKLELPDAPLEIVGLVQAPKEPEIYVYVEIMASFEGDFRAYIDQNIKRKVFNKLKNKKNNYEFVISFNVSDKGKLGDVSIQSKLNKKIQDEVKRVVLNSPLWRPYQLNGKNYPSQVKFKYSPKVLLKNK
jgi:uncharacterized protein (TIGR02145 family)